MEKILKCKSCGAKGQLEPWEIPEDDEGTYVDTCYVISCSDPQCPNQTDPHWTEDDAVDQWNKEYGKRGMNLAELIESRGVTKPDYAQAGVPKDNFWYTYYSGWRAAYQDLKEILEQHNVDMTQIIIPFTNMEKTND